MQVGFVFSMAVVVADIAGQLAAPDQGAVSFGLGGETAALGFWRMWGWILKWVGI